MRIGFIGQGWIGKNYADDFAARGYDIVRYSLDPQHLHNREALLTCDIVFIAVPTPTSPDGFNVNAVRDVLTLVPKGKIAVIKSTLAPGTTEALQNEFPHLYVLHSPEFLVESTAAYNAAHPDRNIIGIPVNTEEYIEKAKDVLAVLPRAPYETILFSRDAEFVKYAGNCFLFTKVIYMNLLYDIVKSMGGDWNRIKEAFTHDPRIGTSHAEPIHKSGRGAGGHCFIKDFEAFRNMYDKYTDDTTGSDVLKALAYKNMQLLVDSNKDLDLLAGVYGDLNKHRAWKDLRDTTL
jgi:nucleotide sugar dehydrogenase